MIINPAMVIGKTFGPTGPLAKNGSWNPVAPTIIASATRMMTRPKIRSDRVTG